MTIPGVWSEEDGSQEGGGQNTGGRLTEHRRAVDRARKSTEEELYRKLDEDGGKNMIFKMARDRTEDGRDVKRGAVIKDNKEAHHRK